MRSRSRPFLLMLGAAALSGCDRGGVAAPEEQAKFDLVVMAKSNSSPDALNTSVFYFGINLSWADNTRNETEFRVLRSSSGPNGSFLTIATTAANVTSYTDTAITASTSYCYQILAYQKSRQLGSSNVACATSPDRKPPAPTNLSLSAQPGVNVAVSWQEAYAAVTGFRIERGSSTSGPWTVLSDNYSSTYYVDNTVPLGVLLCYRISAINAYGAGAPSTATCMGVPAPPTNLTARSVDGHTVDIAWTDASSYEDGYEVMRYGPDGNWVIAAELPPNSTSFRDGNLAVDTRYFYWVRAKLGTIWIGLTETIAVTADVPPPAPVARAFSVASTVVEATWTTSPRDLGYRAERSLDGGTTWEPAASSYTYSYLSAPPILQDDYRPEQPVCYRVSAYNDRGTSPMSNIACTVTVAAPEIIDAVAVDDQTVDLTWIDNSNVEDSFEIDYVTYDGLGDPWYYYVATVPANTTTYRVTGLSGATTYDFVMFAGRNDGGISDQSNDYWVTTSETPTPVSARVIPPRIQTSARAPVQRYMTDAQRRTLLTGANARRHGRSRIPLPVGVPKNRAPAPPLPHSLSGSRSIPQR